MTNPTGKKTGKRMRVHVDRTQTDYDGPVIVDATPVQKKLKDIAPGARQGLRVPRANIEEVIAELMAATTTAKDAAGIPAVLFQAFVTSNADINELRQIYLVAAKLAEVLGETLALNEDTREQQLSQIGDAIRSAAKRSKADGVKAPFQKLLAYLGESASKGQKTKKAKKAAAAATATPAPAAAASPTGH